MKTADLRNLSTLAYGHGLTIFGYRTQDHTLAEVCAEFYFRDADELMKPGDFVMISAKDGGGNRWVGPDYILKPLV